MNYYEVLRTSAEPVEIKPSDTSYFSKPESTLDPRLFRGNSLAPSVRDGILVLLFNHLKI